MTEVKPQHLTDWQGNSWTSEDGTKAAHPNSRFTTPIAQCPTLAEEFHSPNGVPVDVILFGGRRATTVPLVAQARDWQHGGVFMGSTCASETTAAAAGAVGVVRRDPFAMLPFMGYNAGDYTQHWLDMGAKGGGDKMPAIFFVNWFRKSADGKFLWPGFGDNSRVLKWIVERLEGKSEAVDTPPAGLVPAPPGSLDVEGLDITQADLDAAVKVDKEEWRAEVPLIEEWFDKLETIPQPVKDELAKLKQSVEA